jgi:hypothetical protein
MSDGGLSSQLKVIEINQNKQRVLDEVEETALDVSKSLEIKSTTRDIINGSSKKVEKTIESKQSPKVSPPKKNSE